MVNFRFKGMVSGANDFLQFHFSVAAWMLLTKCWELEQVPNESYLIKMLRAVVDQGRMLQHKSSLFPSQIEGKKEVLNEQKLNLKCPLLKKFFV